MKRFTLIFIATLVTMFAWAQTPLTRSASSTRAELKTQKFERSTTQNAGPLSAYQLQMPAKQAKAKAPRRADVVTPPEGEVVYYKLSGSASAQGSNASVNRTVKVIFDGNDVYVEGLSYYCTDKWVKGTIDGATATFASGQYMGNDLGADIYFVGTTGEGVCDVTADYDAETGNFTFNTYILDNSKTDEKSFYAYIITGATLTKIEGDVDMPVEVPEGLEVAEFTVKATSYDYNDNSELVSSPVAFNVVGGFVMTSATTIEAYVQGLCSYLPEAWVKGTGTLTETGAQIVFPTGQYFGNYRSSNDLYFVGLNAVDEDEAEVQDVVFNADLTNMKLTLAEGSYVAINGKKDEPYWYNLYSDVEISQVVDKAATPADPEITGMEETNYGMVVVYNVPTISTDGEGLATSNLFIKFYAETNGTVEELTFTPETHVKLTENMTEVPYTFRDNYDFADGYIYLNDLFSEDWSKIGIQSIYYGGDERNESQIAWFDLEGGGSGEGGEVTATFDFNSYDVPVSSGTGNDYDPAGEITKDYEVTEEDVTLVISPAAEGKTATRWWSTKNGPQLRCYSNTLTFSVPEGMSINTIVFNYNGKYWGGNNNAGNVTADSGEIVDDADSHAATWTGEAQAVVFTIGANTQINSIDVTYTTGEGGGEEEGELVELPEGVDTEVWTIEGIFTEESSSSISVTTEMAFDGTDVYLKGLPYYFEDAWLKGTLDDESGIIVFPSGQYVGSDEYGSEYMVGFSDETYKVEDIVFAYDEARQNLYQVTPYILECADAEGVNVWGYFQKVLLYPGEAKTFEPVAVPEGLKTEDCLFTAMEYVTSSEDEESEEYGIRNKKAPRKIAKKDVEDEDEAKLQEYTFQIKAGVDGNDVYFQGFTDDTSEFWVKGTLSEDGKTVTIPANQFMGTKTIVYWTFNYYLAAVNEELEPEDIVLTYDAETGSFTTNQTVALHDLWYTMGVPYQSFTQIAITKLAEFAATPADPVISSVGLTGSYPQAEFVIPTTDVEDNTILASKLFYTIWIEKDGTEQTLTLAAEDYDYLEEDMTEIPYTYDDNWDIYRGGERVYLNQGAEEIATWTKIGVQSIYYGGGECNKSNVVWYELGEYNGIADVTANGKNAAIYDMQGRRVTKPANGLFIMNGKKILVK